MDFKESTIEWYFSKPILLIWKYLVWYILRIWFCLFLQCIQNNDKTQIKFLIANIYAMAWKRYYTINLFDQILIILCPYINFHEIKPYTHFCHQWLWNPIGNFLNPTYTIFKFIALHHFVCSIFLIRLKETFDKCKTQVEEA